MKNIIGIILSFLCCIQLFSLCVCAETENNNPNGVSEFTEVEGTATFDDDELDEYTESVTEHIPVDNIIISEFDDEMYVDETQNISATVLPSDATNQDITYSSSNNSVAEVNPLGNITAVGKGTCDIYLEADGKIVSYKLTVNVKTNKISVGSSLIILKPTQNYKLNTIVEPKDASQNLTYKSSNESIVTVDNRGTITAKALGNATVIVSNGDSITSLCVIVNSDINNTENIEDAHVENDIEVNSIVDIIRKSEEKTIVVNNLNTITSSILKELYGTDKTLIVECDGYDVILNGMDIKNATNELDTRIVFNEEKNGIQFSINSGKKLPGKIEIQLDNKPNYKYLYLLNNNKYVIVNSLDSNNKFEIDINGTYLLTQKQISQFKLNIWLIVVVVSVIIVLAIVYICLKKKYLFW